MIEVVPPTMAEIRAAAAQLAGRLVRTPVLDWSGRKFRPDCRRVRA